MYRHGMRARRLMPAAAVAAALAWAPVATAAFAPPERASIGPLPARAPDVAVNDRGDAAAVWIRGAGRAAMVVASLRPAGGEWSAPEAISRRGRPAIDPQVGLDARGLAVVTWRQVERVRRIRTGDGRRRQAVYVARARERSLDGGRWSPITTLSSARHKVGPPRLGVDDAGGAVAAWHWGTGTNPRVPGFVGEVQVAERAPGGGWSAPTRVSRSSPCRQVRLPRVAVGARGHGVVWWQCDGPGGRNTAVAIARAPGGSFGSETEMPFGRAGAVSANVVIADSGRLSAVSADDAGALRWWASDVTDSLRLDRLPSLGPVERSDPRAGAPRIAANAAGDALTAWTDRIGRPRAAPIAADLGVGTPATLGPPSDETGGMRVDMADSGRRGALAWTAEGRVVGALRGADGAIGPTEVLSGRGALRAPAVAVDAAGGAVVLWTRSVGGRTVIERAAGPAT
jgi:hypothetical protein